MSQHMPKTWRAPCSDSTGGGGGRRLRSVAELEAEGVPAVLEAHAAGDLLRRHRFLLAAAADLRVVRLRSQPVCSG